MFRPQPASDHGLKLSRLVLLSAVPATSSVHKRLPAAVPRGDIRLYIQVPIGRKAYIDSFIPPRISSNFTEGGLDFDYPSPSELAVARQAIRAGINVIKHPKPVADVEFVGLYPKDAKRLLALESIEVEWFPYLVQLRSKSAEEAKPLRCWKPASLYCCLQPSDGRRKRGPWIGHSPERTLTITLSDVFIEEDAFIDSIGDPLHLRETSPGAYVLFVVASKLNDPVKGVTAPADTVKDAVKHAAKVYGVGDRLFIKEALKHVRKIINSKHSETKGTGEVPDLRTKEVGEDVAELRLQAPWISDRLALLIQACRLWKQITQASGRLWSDMNSKEQEEVTKKLDSSLKLWGLSTGERTTMLRLAMYPDNSRQLKRTA